MWELDFDTLQAALSVPKTGRAVGAEEERGCAPLRSCVSDADAFPEEQARYEPLRLAASGPAGPVSST